MMVRSARSIEQLQLRFAQMPQTFEALDLLIAEVAAIGKQITAELEDAMTVSFDRSESNAA